MQRLRMLAGTVVIGALLMAGLATTSEASSSSPPQIRECGHEFIGVADEHGISHAKACSVSEAARTAGIWACVPGRNYPVPGVKRHRFDAFTVSLTHPELTIWFRDPDKSFILSAQCS
jgi:hypothetical protein